MNASKTFVLLVLQLCIIVGFTLTSWSSLDGLAWTLLGALIGITVLLLVRTLRTRQELKRTSVLLRQAVDGNLKTRLLVKADESWNEVVFTINELIAMLEKVQIKGIQSQAARQRLLTSISHDIRTPLTSIIGYLDAIRDEHGITEQDKQLYLDILSMKSARLKVLIDDLFTMAKLDADELLMNEETIDITEVVRETLIEFLPEIEKGGVELQLNFPDDYCLIEADRISVARIIQNIIKNALLYGKEGNVLGVELIEHNEVFNLIVWDRGPGLSTAELSRVFERSYRSDEARGSHDGGSGLGLSIAKALADKNRGTISADSKPWEKTAFTVSFPKLTGLRNS